MIDPLVFGMATNLASDLLKNAYRGGRDLVVGAPEQRALTQAFARALSELITEMRASDSTADLDTLIRSQFERLLADPEVAGMLLRAARDGLDLDLNRLRERFAELGFDADTFLVDFDLAMTRFQFGLADELLITAGDAGSPLFNRLVLARLESMREQMNRLARSAESPEAGAAGAPRMAAHFVGRDRELGELRDRLATVGSGPQVLTAVHGWPGVGKTALAARLAGDVTFLAETYPDGVLWASVPDASRITIALASWIARLGESVPSPSATSDQLSAVLERALSGRRMLLIVDDVWDPAHVAAFNRGGPECSMLITTRLPAVAEALEDLGAKRYLLGILTEEAAMELLRRLAPDVVEQDGAACLELVRLLERLPLAVQVAGRLLRAEWRKGWGVEDLLVDLREGSALLSAMAPADRVEADHTIPTVNTLLRRSTDLLDDDARKDFAYLGMFAPQPAVFRLEDMAEMWETGDARPRVRQLVARGLLEPVGGGRFSMHAVLVFHALTLLREAG